VSATLWAALSIASIASCKQDEPGEQDPGTDGTTAGPSDGSGSTDASDADSTGSADSTGEATPPEAVCPDRLPDPDADLAVPVQRPYASYWHPNDLLGWEPANDPDARFNRSRVPLRERFVEPSTQCDPTLTADAGIAALQIVFGTSDNPAQGSDVFDAFAFGYWQYIDRFVLWGGSASEGLILAPNATWIDAGHRNGVKVLGTIFFPPIAFGGEIGWVDDMLVEDPDGTFPVADKLIEVARYYGFDGWFINQETNGGDETTAARMQAFMKYIEVQAPDVELMWYDAMLLNGQVSWQDGLNENNAPFFQDGDERVSDTMFLDFGWSGADQSTSQQTALALDRSPYDLFAGVDVQANGYNTNVLWDAVFPEGEAAQTSLGLYVPSWTYHSAESQPQYYENARAFWTGFSGDPCQTNGDASWPGLAHFVPARSVVSEVPFVTRFNTGHGTAFFIDGEQSSGAEWNNLSAQDVLPTWRYLATGGLEVSIDFNAAYNGGSSLAVRGSLSEPAEVGLFKAAIPVEPDTQLRTTFRGGAARFAGPSLASIAVTFLDAPREPVVLALGESQSGWTTTVHDLAEHAGRTIATLSVHIESDRTIGEYALSLGELAVTRSVPACVEPPQDFAINAMVDGETAAATFVWAYPGPDVVWYYDVMRVHTDGTRSFVGRTPNSIYHAPTLTREGDEATTTFELIAVAADGTPSDAQTAVLTW